jgi:tRNA (guanosine-2'-O-)-methyltransferase
LRRKGFKIIATTPEANVRSIEDLEVDFPIALVLGNERDGVSDYIKRSCDEVVHIPMFGFTESYNISVSAGLSLWTLVNKMRVKGSFQLEEDERKELRLSWYKKVVKRSNLIEEEFLKSIS